ncbi:MAG: hypothetical protein ISR35_02885 [Planctomycetes bacterium]|nr:hypothetical protein [Planctomycetota bacterium]
MNKFTILIAALFIAAGQFICGAVAQADHTRPAFVATSQEVTGGILGSNPLLADGLNVLLASNLASSPFLLEVANLDDPTYTNDPDIVLNAFSGVDRDGDVTNNGSGTNMFIVTPDSMDPVTGGFVSSFPGGNITNGLLTAGPGTIIISGIPLNDLTVSADFSETATPGIFEFTSTPTAAFLTESFLVTLPAPDPFTGTLVDVLNQFGIFPDTDADGDGTNDAYSAEFVFSGISCEITPVDPTPLDGFVATSQVVTGGILGSNPLLADGLNALLEANLISDPFLLQVDDLDDPTYFNDPDITLKTWDGVDEDGDPTNNFDGTNSFLLSSDSYDDNGNPVSAFPGGSITDGFLSAGPGTIVISGIPLNNLTVEADFSETAIPGIFEFTSTPTAAFLTESFLVTLPAPDPFSGTLVDVLSQFGIFPDVDGDGDGTNESYSAEFVFTGISCTLYGNDFGPGGPTPVEDCSNGLDDDGDSLADCDDPDCFSAPGCVTGIQFRRGDINSDAAINIADAVALLGFLFSGAAAPGCSDSGDTNDDGSLNIADAVSLLGFLFSGAAEPPAPGVNCGVDPTDTDPLDCQSATSGC